MCVLFIFLFLFVYFSREIFASSYCDFSIRTIYHPSSISNTCLSSKIIAHIEIDRKIIQYSSNTELYFNLTINFTHILHIFDILDIRHFFSLHQVIISHSNCFQIKYKQLDKFEFNSTILECLLKVIKTFSN